MISRALIGLAERVRTAGEWPVHARALLRAAICAAVIRRSVDNWGRVHLRVR